MEKIKAIDPKIVVSGSANKPYYSIEYYNISDKRWHIGYGSYSLKFVKEWLTDDFEIVEADVVPVVHGHWIYNPNGMDFNLGAWECSVCTQKNNNLPCSRNISPYIFVGSKYCPNCGAKMDGGDLNGS